MDTVTRLALRVRV
ncbi:hypothetical protein F383_36321 [Gossypium arboreum]|uniref:Uncharacterized protein n=1 Tax=Gossypium arboreum TaxID=29729 RepID=A0A0B0PV74_GOSAR|nr:hypothetical protein F383_36321 [Gossypium arboreum]